jgi:hypothetical protein
MHPGSPVLLECSALPAILPRSFQLCQNGGLSVLASTGKETKVRRWDDVLGKNDSVKEESVRPCVVVMKQPVLFSAKFGVKSAHIFTQSP